MPDARFFELNYHLPKLQLLEVFPLMPFLWQRTGMVSIDVGANVGLWSETYLKVFGAQTSRHLMAEPMPANAERLRKRCANILSRLCDGVEVREVAVGASHGQVQINFDTDVTTLASVRNTASAIGRTTVALGKSITVPQVTIDDELDRLGLHRVDFMKVDVEGYEMSVFEGAGRAIREGRIDNILFEFGAHQMAHGESLKQHFDHFRANGLRMYRSHRARNFFGLTEIDPYLPAHEPSGDSVEMLLVSRTGPHPSYSGPRVVTRQPIVPKPA